ncbi:MAG TPA: CPBP family glutamic-type intramembrane protease [Sphingomicrobium sp.]
MLDWTPPLSWLPRGLLEPANPWKAIAIGWGLAFPVSILIAITVGLIAPHAETPKFPGIGGPLLLFLLVIFSPVVESLIMGGVLLVLLRFLRPTTAVLVSAIGWGVAHSFQVAIWGLIIWWPFLIFSTLFVAWRERSLWLAFGMPMAVHALHNLPTSLIVAAGVS